MTKRFLPVRLPIPRFLSAGEIFIGPGSFGVVRTLSASRAFVLCSASLLKNEDVSQKIRSSIGAVDHLIAANPSGEPKLESIYPIVAQLMDFKPDWIVAIGGGSVIDAAKIAWAFYEHPHLEIERITRPFGLLPLRGKAKLVAVPTTSGTGSEVSSSAVFHDQTGQKQFVVSHDLLPDVVILDPNFALHTPAEIIRFSAFDALAHAVEGYVSKFANPFLDAQAELVVQRLFKLLPQTKSDTKDVNLLQELLITSLMAGWVQNMKIPGAAHAVAHQLGQFGIPHGLACGLLLGPSVRINSNDAKTAAKYDRLMPDLAKSIEHLKCEVGLPAGLRDVLKGKESEWMTKKPLVIQNALTDICARANPLQLDAEIVANLIELAL